MQLYIGWQWRVPTYLQSVLQWRQEGKPTQPPPSAASSLCMYEYSSGLKVHMLSSINVLSLTCALSYHGLDVWWWLQSLNQSDRTCGDVFITRFNTIGCHCGVGWHKIDIWASHKLGTIILYKHTLSLTDKIVASFPGLHTQFLSIAVQKVGGKAWKDLSRDVCRCTSPNSGRNEQEMGL